jgi:hypothetical protein
LVSGPGNLFQSPQDLVQLGCRQGRDTIPIDVWLRNDGRPVLPFYFITLCVMRQHYDTTSANELSRVTAASSTLS